MTSEYLRTCFSVLTIFINFEGDEKTTIINYFRRSLPIRENKRASRTYARNIPTFDLSRIAGPILLLLRTLATFFCVSKRPTRVFVHRIYLLYLRTFLLFRSTRAFFFFFFFVFFFTIARRDLATFDGNKNYSVFRGSFLSQVSDYARLCVAFDGFSRRWSAARRKPYRRNSSLAYSAERNFRSKVYLASARRAIKKNERPRKMCVTSIIEGVILPPRNRRNTI